MSRKDWNSTAYALDVVKKAATTRADRLGWAGDFASTVLAAKLDDLADAAGRDSVGFLQAAGRYFAALVQAGADAAKLADLCRSGIAAAGSEDAQAEAQSWWTVASGTVVKSAQDARAIGETAGAGVTAATSFLKTPIGMITAAVVAIGIVVFLVKRR